MPSVKIIFEIYIFNLAIAPVDNFLTDNTERGVLR